MKIKKIALSVAVLVMSLVVFAATANAATNMEGYASANWGISAVPAPGPVTIDGDLSEWDWSGRIKTFRDYRYTDIYSAEVATMWDKDALYFAAKFTDHTPMEHSYDPEQEIVWTWRGDAVQFRLNTDRTPCWTTLAYYPDKDMGSWYIVYADTEAGFGEKAEEVGYVTEPGGSKLDRVVYKKGEPQHICLDAEVKYKKWEDGKGYNVEFKIPWCMILSNTNVVAGTSFRLSVETYWGDVSGNANYLYKHYDVFQPGKYVSGFNTRAYDSWGDCVLLPSGNIAQREYIPDPETDINGSIHIPVKVPKNAKKVTLVLEDKYGNRVSNAVSELDVENNIIGEEGDYYIVDATWDGTALLGDMVTPGEYTVRGIYHEGIEPFFDIATYNPGTPPWQNSLGTGGWGSDHMAPVSVASSTSSGATFIGWPACESGRGMIGVGEDGLKKWDIKRGANILAADDKYIYAIPGDDVYASTAEDGNGYLMRLEQETGDFALFTLDGEQRPLELFLADILGLSRGVVPNPVGLAANGKVLALATEAGNSKLDVGKAVDYGSAIYILDAESAKMLRRIPVEDVGSIAFTKDGKKLYAVSGNSIIEVNPSNGKTKKVSLKLEDGVEIGPIALDSEGNIVFYDKGADRNIKAYNTNGTLVYTIGKKGGRKLVGEYDPTGFCHRVSQISVDSKDHIWVVENWDYPRRVSVWNRDGSMINEYIGSAGYMGAGGFLHEDDPEKYYCGPIEVELDRENYTYEVKRILWVPDLSKGQTFPMQVISNPMMQHFRTTLNGVENEFIYVSSSQNDKANVLYRECEDGTFKPFFATGYISSLYVNIPSTNFKDRREVLAYLPDEVTSIKDCFPKISALPDDTQFLWNDLDYDGAVEYEECEFYNYLEGDRKLNQYGAGITDSGWGNRVTEDMRFILTNAVGGEQRPTTGYIVTPDYFTEDGLPRYSFNSFKEIEAEYSLFFNENVLTTDTEGDDIVLSVQEMGGISPYTYFNGIKAVDVKTGKDLWWYSNPHPGVHGSHTSPAGGDGLVIGPIKLLGVVEVDGEKFFMLRGNMGQDFIFTVDGYYVQTLFRDGREPQKTLPDTMEEAIGMSLAEFTENGEPFSGTLVKHSDGKVRLVSGMFGPTSIISTIEGFDTVERLEPFKIRITQEDIDEAIIFNNTDPVVESNEEEKKEERNEYTIAKLETPATIDSKAFEWINVDSLDISKEGISESAKVKLAYDDVNLYALFDVTDPTPMANAGNDYTVMYKSGDACDINISPTASTKGGAVLGDMRIILSEMKGVPIAVLMKEVDTDKTYQKLYGSSVRQMTFDTVKILEDAEMSIERYEGSRYIIEVKIPLASLGLTPNENMLITGDVGIITSNTDGNANAARIYLHRKDTGLVSDIPGESQIFTDQWGKFRFGAGSGKTE